jgi:hypothetical protein
MLLASCLTMHYRGRLPDVLFAIKSAGIAVETSYGWNRRQSNRFQHVKPGAVPRRKTIESESQITIWLL